MIDNYIKFAFIGLCFLIALCSYWFCYSKRDWAYLVSAMGFTLTADFFLVIRHSYHVGVLVFCFVHMAYIMRVRGESPSYSKFSVAIAFMIGILIGIFLPALGFPLLVRLATLYAFLFAVNIIAHIKYYRRGGHNRRIMLAGLILFALCDIHVMLFNLPHFLPVPHEIALWGQRWIWVYYAPSQLLLSVSAARNPTVFT